MIQRTLIGIKPDAVERNLIAKILLEFQDFKIIAIRSCQFTVADAETFYAVHKGKEFYNRLCEYMASGTSIFVILEGDEAIKRVRSISEFIVRPAYAETVTRNSIHSSDSLQSSKNEMKLIFDDME